MPKQPLIVIIGPTASGKSDLGVTIAKKINGEIISADSRQVYRGLDVGTGKITKKEMRGIPHHCLNIVNPKHQFSVSEYQREALRAIENVRRKGKDPVLVGGTGFYIDAVLYKNTFTDVPPNKKLRRALEVKDAAVLFTMLKKLDAGRAHSIDPRNKRRLIRALEIVKTRGTSIPKEKRSARFNVLSIGIRQNPTILKKSIAKRVDQMIAGGLVQEVRKLKKSGLSAPRIRAFGFEYRYPLLYLAGNISKPEMVQKITTETWHYAKRQMTWFKKMKNVYWIKKEKEALGLVAQFLKNR